MKPTAMLCAIFALALVLYQATGSSVRASEPAPAAIAGQVTSAAEGAMEGVVVTAHKDGSIVSVSVTTDPKGHYAFPENRLEPGHYTLAIRAVGYDLAAPTAADVVGEQTSNVDLKLLPTKDLADQLTDAEWMMSIPGTDDQKAALLNCTSCHTLERVVLSTHNTDEWMQVVQRMMSYGAVSQPVKPQPMLDKSRAGTPEQYRKLAEYLATINLSSVDKWAYPLKTLPRPTGDSTRVIVTEYSLPRPTIVPHDIVRDTDGNVWYTDFGEMFVSKLDPKTLKLTEYPIKTFKPDAPVGLLSLAFDKEGMLWFDTMYQGALGSLDPKTGATKYYPLAAKWNDNRIQLNFVGLRHDVDDKVWTKDVGTKAVFRLDLATGNWERFRPTDLLPDAADHHYGIYQVISDAQNNLWMAEFSEGYLGKIDAKTLKVTWYTPPTPHARLRRMEIRPNGDIVATEYRGNKVAVFDPKTEKFTEYALPPYTYPYRANFDKNGDIWASTMSTDRVVRMNPKTGQSDQYLMPSDTNMRTVYIDSTTDPVGFWVGSNHDHALVHVEPLN
ncbi:MAG: carboxypeptidase regulatory-like domain-containing protein [Xanthobacteraceae bacterium]